MTDETILKDLLSKPQQPELAWETFLRRFSNLILKVVWHFEKDYDEAMEKYLFVCRKLAENDFARLRRFQQLGPKSPRFTTWLAAVTNNLCIDSHRARHGRRQIPRPISRLSEFDREVFRLYYWKGYSHEEINGQLAKESRGQPSAVIESLSRIQESLGGKAGPLSGKSTTISLDENDPRFVSDENDPDADELLTWLQTWLNRLTDQEQLIIRLRFWEDMTGPEIAQAMSLSPEQKVYTLLQKALSHLREEARKTYEGEKSENASVSHTVNGRQKNAS